MKKINITLLVALVLFTANCNTKDEEIKPTPESTPASTEVYLDKTVTNLFEINSLTIQGVNVTEINASIGGKEFVLARTESNKYLYITPSTLTPGEHSITFTVNGKSYSSPVTVVNKVIIDNPESTISNHQDFIKRGVNEFGSSLSEFVANNQITEQEKQQKINDIEAFNNEVFQKLSSLTAEEKLAAATFIEVNKSILQNDSIYSSLGKNRSMAFNSNHLRFSVSVITLLGSGYCVLYGDPVIKLAGLAGLYLSFNKALIYGEAANIEAIRPVSVLIQEVKDFFEGGRIHGDILLQSNNTEKCKVNITRASITAKDRDNSNTLIRGFFNSYDKLTNISNSINSILENLTISKRLSPFTISNSVRQEIGGLSEGAITIDNISKHSLTGQGSLLNDSIIIIKFDYQGSEASPLNFNATVNYTQSGFAPVNQLLGFTILHCKGIKLSAAGGDRSISASVSGGHEPYTFYINGKYPKQGSSASWDNVIPGKVIVSVKDTLACSKSESVEVFGEY